MLFGTETHPAASIEPESIRILNPLEVANWDQQVAILPGATFFHTAAWARVLYDTYNFHPLYLTQTIAGRLHSLLPLFEVDSWITGRRGVSLPFTDAIEPLCPDASSFGSLYEEALALAKKRQWKYFECRGGRKWLPAAPASISYFSHWLKLQTDDIALFKQCDESVRRAVRKGEKSGLTIEFSQSLNSMQAFYDVHCQTRKRHGVPPQPFSFFANIQRCVLAKELGWVVLARKGRVVVASAVFFHFGNTAIYKFGASNEDSQQLRANNVVMWQAIQWYARNGFVLFDFGRTSLHNAGLRRFKLGWGSQEDHIDYFTYDFRKVCYRATNDASSGWHTRIFNVLPVTVSRLIGTALYRHIG